MVENFDFQQHVSKSNHNKSYIGRVAYILDSFPNISETFVSNEINELLRMGWDVRIFALHRPKSSLVHSAARRLLEVTTYLPRPVPNTKILRSMFSLLTRNFSTTVSILLKSRSLPGNHFRWTARQAIYLSKQISDLNCDRIHVHFAAEASRYGMLVSKFLDIPYTLTVHSPLGQNESQEHTLSIVGKDADAVITVSAFNKSYISKNFNLDPSKIYVNPNGIQSDVFKSDATILRIPGRILTVARLHPDKGISYAVEAAGVLKRLGINFHWIIIGDGPDREAIDAHISALGLNDNVKLLGFQSASRVLEELRIASIFVLPSVSEAQPVVYLESMATGTPIIGTNIPGVSETIIDGESGALVPIGDYQVMAVKILELLNDENLRDKFSRTSIKRIADHYLLPDRVLRLTEIWAATKKFSG